MGNYYFFTLTIVVSALKSCINHFYKYIFFPLFLIFFSFKIGCLRDLIPACKTRETLRQVLFYLFCVTFMEPFLNRNAFLLRFWEHVSLLKIWKRLLSHRILRGFQNYGLQIYVIYVATWFLGKGQRNIYEQSILISRVGFAIKKIILSEMRLVCPYLKTM